MTRSRAEIQAEIDQTFIEQRQHEADYAAARQAIEDIQTERMHLREELEGSPE